MDIFKAWYLVKHRENFNFIFSLLKGRDHSGNLGVDGSIVLTEILKIKYV